MLNTQQKLKLMREAKADPGVAFLSFFQMMSDEITALLSHNMEKLQADEADKHGLILKTIEGISADFSKAIIEIRASVAEVNNIEIDEEKIIDGLAGKIIIPDPIAGHTPTEEELLALIRPLIPSESKAVSQEAIREMIREIMPKIEDGKPMSEEEIVAIVEPIMAELKKNDAGEDPQLEDRIGNLEKQIKTMIQIPSGKGKKPKYLHGGGDTVLAGSGITITANSDGTKTIASSGSGAAGSVISCSNSGDNQNYTLSQPLSTSSYYALINNLPYTTDDPVRGFSIAALTLTFNSALPADIANKLIKIICV